MFPTPGSRVGHRINRMAIVGPLTILQRTSNQSINNTTDTLVSWDTPGLQDDIGAFANASPTIVTVRPNWTICRVSVFTNWTSNGTGARNIVIRKNGVNFDGQAMPASNESAVHWATKWHSFAVGDQLSLDVFQSSGGSLNLDGGSSLFGHCYMQFEWAPPF